MMKRNHILYAVLVVMFLVLGSTFGCDRGNQDSQTLADSRAYVHAFGIDSAYPCDLTDLDSYHIFAKTLSVYGN